MTVEEKLASVYSKIDRAQQHILELTQVRQAFLESYPYKIGIRHDHENKKIIYYVESVQPTPLIFACIAGDVIQNLKSSLDHLAYQLFLLNREDINDIGKNINFPSTKPDEDLFKKHVRGMSENAISALGDVEAYEGGKAHKLWQLTKLNNIDKHRLLITVAGAIGGVGISHTVRTNLPFSCELSIKDFLRPADIKFPLEQGDILFIDMVNDPIDDRPSNPGEPYIEVIDVLPEEREFKFDIAFGDKFDIAFGEMGFEGAFLIETLQGFVEVVNTTVLSFRSHFES
jgi:hypothetical protein